MKSVMLICIVLIHGFQCSAQKQINDYLANNNIAPQMISYHPDGEWFISTKASKESKPQLLRISSWPTNPVIDTLDFGYYLNISKLSNDGSHLLYSFYDSIAEIRRTYLRAYNDGKFSDYVDVKLAADVETLTYFMLDEDENIYYYTYSADPKGLYYLPYRNGKFGKSKLLIANKPNYVPFSPYLFGEDIMILAQHGKEDKSVNGIYATIKQDGKWIDPVKIDGIAYGWSFGKSSDKDKIMYVTDAGEIMYLNKKDLLGTIKKLFPKSF